MASSGALSGFLDAMYRVRAQNIAAEEAKAASELAGMQGLISGISSGAGSLLAGATTASGNAAANSIMNQAAPPRAQAVTPGTTTVDPAINAAAASVDPASMGQVPYSTIPAGSLAPATGGKAELDMKTKMAELTKGKGSDLMSQMRMKLSMDAAERAKTAAADSKANTLFNRKTEEADKIYRDSMAYQSSSRALMDKIVQAPDQDTYINLSTQLNALNDMHQGRKLTTPLVQAPPYMSPADKKALAALDAAQQGMVGQPSTSWGMTTTPQAALNTANAEAAGGQSSMASYNAMAPQGAPVAGAAPSGAAPAGAIPLPTGSQNVPDGTPATGPDGKMYIKQGNMLVPRQ